MPQNICCIAFKAPSHCTHPLAPVHWFSTPTCIETFDPADVRYGNACQIKHPLAKPSLTLVSPPPKQE